MRFDVKVNGETWKTFECYSDVLRARNEIESNRVVSACRGKALAYQKKIFESVCAGIDVKCIDSRGVVIAHGYKRYDDDSEVWARPCDTDDAYRLIRAIICRAILDEQGQSAGGMNLKEQNAHDAYMSREDGLKYDCELVELNYAMMVKGLKDE